MKKLLLTTCLVLAISLSANALPVYEGMLSTPTGVTATGYWVHGFQISWHVEQQANNSWLYQYLLTKVGGDAIDTGAVSHFTVEVSPDVTIDDFWGANGSPIELGSWDESDYIEKGLKLDFGAQGQSEWSFYSWRMPVWGDFYAKDGRAGGEGLNTAKNAGYLAPDPLAAATNGSIDYKILRPDTVIPEPGTLGLLGLGLVGLATRMRQRKTKK